MKVHLTAILIFSLLLPPAQIAWAWGGAGAATPLPSAPTPTGDPCVDAMNTRDWANNGLNDAINDTKNAMDNQEKKNDEKNENGKEQEAQGNAENAAQPGSGTGDVNSGQQTQKEAKDEKDTEVSPDKNQTLPGRLAAAKSALDSANKAVAAACRSGGGKGGGGGGDTPPMVPPPPPPPPPKDGEDGKSSDKANAGQQFTAGDGQPKDSTTVKSADSTLPKITPTQNTGAHPSEAAPTVTKTPGAGESAANNAFGNASLSAPSTGPAPANTPQPGANKGASNVINAPDITSPATGGANKVVNSNSRSTTIAGALSLVAPEEEDEEGLALKKALAKRKAAGLGVAPKKLIVVPTSGPKPGPDIFPANCRSLDC